MICQSQSQEGARVSCKFCSIKGSQLSRLSWRRGKKKERKNNAEGYMNVDNRPGLNIPPRSFGRYF